MLIYKVSTKILKENWLNGIGYGQFKVKYNKYQAEYFISNPIDNKEALLADNSYYTFNDFYQFIIENGIIGVLVLILGLFLIYKRIKAINTNKNNKHLFVASIASLSSIAIGALLSYPLQVFQIIFQAILCLSLLFCIPSKTQQSFYLKFKVNYIFKSLLIIPCIFFSIYFGSNFIYQYKNKVTENLAKVGYRLKAIEEYKQLYNAKFKDGLMLYNYAHELYNTNKLQEALIIIEQTKKYFNAREVFQLSANINNELENFEQAEKEYKTAIYMVPNRMVTRNNLLDFYLERKDTINAIYWANSIRNMPVKIPSLTTVNIQQKAKETLMKLNR